MAIDNQTKSKSVALSAIMGDKKLAIAINDALKSKPGSTKRARAKAILSSLNRSSGPQDGQGGAGGPFDAFNPAGATYNPAPGTYNPGGTTYNPTMQSEQQQGLSVSGQSQTGSVSVGQSQQNQDLTVQEPKQTFILNGAPRRPGVSEMPESERLALERDNARLGTEMPESERLALERDNARLGTEGTFKTPTGDEPATLGAVEANNYYDEWYGSLNEAGKIEYKTLYDSLKQNVGPKTFAYNVLQEEEGKGATLAGRLVDLEELLKDEYNLEDLQKNVTDLENRGITIEDDLQNYIRSRDTYLDKINTLIDESQDKVSTADMGNPATARMMNKYTNYLHILRGRQNLRYQDYLDQAITYHDAEVKRAEDRYETANDSFKEQFRQQGAIAKEDYEATFDILTEMYESVEKMEEEQLKLDKLRNEVIETNNEIAIETLGGGTGNMTNAQKTTSQQNFFEENPGKTLVDWGMLSLPEKLAYEAKGDAGGNKSEDMEWGRNFIRENLAKMEEDRTKINLAISKITGNTELTAGEITNLLGEFGFTKRNGRWR